jgi:outer membrane protein assembly factor BamB
VHTLLVALLLVVPTTVLPKPPFPAPAGAGSGAVRFQVVSSTPIDPAVIVKSPKPHGLTIDGEDGNTQHYVLGRTFTFDFRDYARPPRIAPGEKEFTYEQVVWAQLAPTGVLYVENAHQTYAKSSYGRNAYVSAVDPKTRRLLWRSPALVANADNFVLLNGTIVSGYGFTDEPDYLYALDHATGKVKGRLLLPSAPQTIARHGSTLTVTTYDHRLVVKVVGG